MAKKKKTKKAKAKPLVAQVDGARMCALCGDIFSSWDSFESHIINEHRTTIAEYGKQHTLNPVDSPHSVVTASSLLEATAYYLIHNEFPPDFRDPGVVPVRRELVPSFISNNIRILSELRLWFLQVVARLSERKLLSNILELPPAQIVQVLQEVVYPEADRLAKQLAAKEVAQAKAGAVNILNVQQTGSSIPALSGSSVAGLEDRAGVKVLADEISGYLQGSLDTKVPPTQAERDANRK